MYSPSYICAYWGNPAARSHLHASNASSSGKEKDKKKVRDKKHFIKRNGIRNSAEKKMSIKYLIVKEGDFLKTNLASEWNFVGERNVETKVVKEMKFWWWKIFFYWTWKKCWNGGQWHSETNVKQLLKRVISEYDHAVRDGGCGVEWYWEFW